VRAKAGGGLAGHNGLKSLRQHLGTDAFPRVRIGIGKPPSSFRGAGADWVLRPWDEKPVEIDLVLELAADVAESIIADGVDRAMARWNAD
jgi:PTH1 family peptidyl-tRNA hydrolase